MRLKTGFILLLIMVAGLLSLTVLPAGAGDTVTVDVSRIPLVFIENQGQKSAEVLYHASAAGHSIFFTPDSVVCAWGGDDTRPVSSVAITIAGQNPDTCVKGEDLLPGTANFLIGDDPEKWVTSVPTFGKVRYEGVLPGVDIVYYGTQGALKRDIMLAPGIDPAGVVIRYSGHESLSVGEDGALLVETTGGTLVEAKPLCYQVIDEAQVSVACEYLILGESEVGFSVGPYDPAYSLVIDPFLDFSTYLGGSWDDRGYAVAVDALGGTYVTGATGSMDFPYPYGKPRYQMMNKGGLDVFVTKFEPPGTTLNYSTYIGGYNDDSGQGIAVNSSGYAFITGYTISPNYPVWKAFQQNKSGGGYCTMCSDADAFITVLAPRGNALEYSSFLGGNLTDIGQAIALNSSENPVLTGYTGSWDFPNTTGAYKTHINGTLDAFVTGISYDGTISNIAFSTYLGGEGIDKGFGIAVDNATDRIWVTGLTRSQFFPIELPLRQNITGSQDAFVTSLFPDVSALYFSTYLGNSGDEAGYGIDLDPSGYVYVTGYTQSSDFDVVNPFQSTLKGIQDAFLVKYEPDGQGLNFSTYLGGNLVDEGTGVKVDDMGSAFLTGFTDSTNYPTVNALYNSITGYPYDAYVTRFYPNGTTLMFSTYLGGKLEDRAMGIALHGANATVTGYTASPDFPLKNPFQPTFHVIYDAFVARIASIPPTANFTAEANGVTNYTLIKGLPPLLVNFTDLSTGEPTSWAWLFGDSGTSALQHPSHTYNTGNWTVNLTVSNLEGMNSTSKPFYIQVGVPLIVNFSANVSDVECAFCQGQVPFDVNFTDLTNDTPLSWNWSFGDGNFSINQHPNWTYHIPGLYDVSLNVTNEYGFNSTTKYYLVEAGDVPIANFTNTTPRVGVAPFNAIFTDLSFGIPNITMWNWSFANSSSVSWFNTTNAALRNANHTFTARGNYTVNLTVYNLYGNDTHSEIDFIRVGELPIANFTADSTSVVEGDLVNFTDWSTGFPDWWQWNFGDGTILDRTVNTTLMPVNHSYSNAGNYSVSLTVGNEFGTNTLQRPRYILVGGTVTVVNLTFVPSSAIIPTNSTTAMKLIVENAEQGLSGYNITIYFTNLSAADMVTFDYPSWVNPSYAVKSGVPAPSAWMMVADLGDAVDPGDTNVDLALFNSTGKVPMSTTINVTVTRMDTDTGDPVITIVNPATVTIVALLPLPGQPNPPTDPYHDGVYWDLNGDGFITLVDLFLYFNNMDWIAANEPISLFDYNGNGHIDFNDLYLLFMKV
ncbi:MAG: PKD domain protein [Methanoregulaceae archaeon PtaB.Bin009]|nr:MAG: PKD domain protein [Methanoregulaceae archaeon PtaB.Bin009]OPY42035.1 MAG: PKD domain protein [Methanoregulaceae archaeon PtaU1.Bin066]